MRHEKQQFTGETIQLDGNDYIDCSFDKCRFVYGGGEFNIERIRFDEMEFTVEGPAARTVMLLRALCASPAGRQAVLGLLQQPAP